MKKLLLALSLLGLTEQIVSKDAIKHEDSRSPKNRKCCKPKQEKNGKKQEHKTKDKKEKKHKNNVKKTKAQGKSPLRERGGDKDKDKNKKGSSAKTKKTSVQSIRINNYREKEKKEIK